MVVTALAYYLNATHLQAGLVQLGKGANGRIIVYQHIRSSILPHAVSAGFPCTEDSILWPTFSWATSTRRIPKVTKKDRKDASFIPLFTRSILPHNICFLY